MTEVKFENTREGIDQLTRMLEDHSCWDHMPGGVVKTLVIPHAMNILTPEAPTSFASAGPWRHPDFGRAVEAAIREVTTGEIFGSPDKCCVCGEGSVEHLHKVITKFIPGAYVAQMHDDCTARFFNPAVEGFGFKSYAPRSREDNVRVILRARKLYRAEQAQKHLHVEVCKQVTTETKPASEHDGLPFVIRMSAPCRLVSLTIAEGSSGEVRDEASGKTELLWEHAARQTGKFGDQVFERLVIRSDKQFQYHTEPVDLSKAAKPAANQPADTSQPPLPVLGPCTVRNCKLPATHTRDSRIMCLDHAIGFDHFAEGQRGLDRPAEQRTTVPPWSGCLGDLRGPGFGK